MLSMNALAKSKTQIEKRERHTDRKETYADTQKETRTRTQRLQKKMKIVF